MTEQQDGGESHLQRRLRMAERLAEQMRAAPQENRPLPLPEEVPPQPRAASAPSPSARESGAQVRQAPAPERPVPEHPPAQAAAPIALGAAWPLLREFTDSAGLFRQLSIGDLLDAAFRLYRRRFRTLIGIAALLLLPMAAAQILFQQSQGGQTMTLLLQNVVILPLLSATLIHCIALTSDRDSIPFREFYRAGLRRLGTLLVASFLEGLLIGLPLVVVAACLFATLFSNSLRGSTTPVIVVAVVAVVLALPIVTRFALTNQAVVLERCRAVQSLRRSWGLTSGWFWRTFWVSTCASILSYLIAVLPALAVGFVLRLAGAASAGSIASSLTTIISQLGLIAALPLQAAIGTLLYYDLRIRGEGYDLEVLAQQIDPASV